jgi:hypothetical protein
VLSVGARSAITNNSDRRITRTHAIASWRELVSTREGFEVFFEQQKTSRP